MDRIEAIRKRLAALDNEEWKQKGHSVICQRGIIAQCPTPQQGGTFACQQNAALIADAPVDLRYLLKRLGEREKEIAMYMHIRCSADNCCTSGRDCSGGRTHPNYAAQSQEA